MCARSVPHGDFMCIQQTRPAMLDSIQSLLPQTSQDSYLGPSCRAANSLLGGLGQTVSLSWPCFHNMEMIGLD